VIYGGILLMMIGDNTLSFSLAIRENNLAM
jgi:hypothetical protein